MITLNEQVDRVQQRITAEKHDALRLAKEQSPMFNRLTEEQFFRLYDNYVAAGYPNDWLSSAQNLIDFLDWSITSPIKSVILNDLRSQNQINHNGAGEQQ